MVCLVCMCNSKYDRLRDMSDDDVVVVVDGETNGTALTCIPVDWPENRRLVSAAHPRWRSHELARLKWRKKNWILRILSYLAISIQSNTRVNRARTPSIGHFNITVIFANVCCSYAIHSEKSINISEEPTNTAAKWVNLTAQHMISSVPLPEPLSLCRPSWVSSFSLDFFFLLLRFVVAHLPSQVRKHVVHVRRIPQAQHTAFAVFLSLTTSLASTHKQTEKSPFSSESLRKSLVSPQLGSVSRREFKRERGRAPDKKISISILHHLAMTRLFTFGGSIELSN